VAWSLVQQSAAQANGAASVSLPGPSTAGTLLICTASSNSIVAIVPPAGWVVAASVANSATVESYILAYFSNPGGISSCAPTGGTGSFQLCIGEFTCPNVALVAAASSTGSQTGGAVTNITVTTGGGAKPGDLSIVTGLQHIASAVITWTDPAGYTEFSGLVLNNLTNHQYAALDLGLAAGGAQSVTITSSATATGTGWAGVAATFSVPPPPAQAAAPGLTWRHHFQYRQSIAYASNSVSPLSTSVTASGSQATQTGKPLAAAASAAGVLSNQAGKLLAAAATAAGTVTRQVGKLAPAVATAAGTLTRQVGKAISGAATATGTILRGIGRVLAGAVSAVAALIIPSLPPSVHHATITITAAGPLAAQVAVTAATTAEVAITPAGDGAAAVTITPN
jgi:hypothetical protein